MCAVASLIMVQKEETREENEYNIVRGYAFFWTCKLTREICTKVIMDVQLSLNPT